MPDLLHRDLTDKIIGAYYEVYNGLSRTYPEFVYENALLHELAERQVRYNRQREYQIFYKEWLVGVQRLDILVAEEVVVEVKVAPSLSALHQAQAMSYLKTVGKQVGLLLNFGSSAPEFKRVFFAPRSDGSTANEIGRTLPDLLFPELSYSVIGGLLEVHNVLGPAFIHRIYANACYREMQARGLAVQPLREMVVLYRGQQVGTVKLGHLQIEDRVMVFPLAVRNTRQVEPENLRRWMASQHVPLGIVANFSAERLELTCLRVTGD